MGNNNSNSSNYNNNNNNYFNKYNHKNNGWIYCPKTNNMYILPPSNIICLKDQKVFFRIKSNFNNDNRNNNNDYSTKYGNNTHNNNDNVACDIRNCQFINIL